MVEEKIWGSPFYINFIIEYKCSELAECVTYLPFIVKMKCDNYCGTIEIIKHDSYCGTGSHSIYNAGSHNLWIFSFPFQSKLMNPAQHTRGAKAQEAAIYFTGLYFEAGDIHPQ